MGYTAKQIAVTLDDETALNGVELFPMWKTTQNE